MHGRSSEDSEQRRIDAFSNDEFEGNSGGVVAARLTGSSEHFYGRIGD